MKYCKCKEPCIIGIHPRGTEMSQGHCLNCHRPINFKDRFVNRHDELTKRLEFEAIEPDKRVIPLSRRFKIFLSTIAKTVIIYIIMAIIACVVILIASLVIGCFYE